MTRFFLAGAERDSDAEVEAAYLNVRERSLVAIGCAAKPRRIFKLDCRFEGSDCEIAVGQQLPHGGDLVVAIFDHGRDEPYAVHTCASGEEDMTRVARPVYGVIDFA